MKLALLMCVTFGIVTLSFATSVAERSLDDQVRDAAFIVVGHVKAVTMTGRFGWPVRDTTARTGPGSRNKLWLHVEFDRSAVLKGAADRLPSMAKLPLWQGWSKDLGGEREFSLEKNFIFFLSSDVMPVSEQFQHFNFERAKIEKAISHQKKRPNSEQRSAAP